HGSWCWPNDSALKYPPLVNVIVPILSNAADRLTWRNLDDVDSDFVVAKQFAGISNIHSDLSSIVDLLIPSPKMRSWDDFDALRIRKWFFPIGAIVNLVFSILREKKDGNE
ncbi:hypothetical protein Tco_1374706, partial [Tanacetum coccineum]